MFCTHCGKTVQEGMKFCMYCGTPVSDGPAPAQQPPQEEAPHSGNNVYSGDFGEKVYAGKNKSQAKAAPAPEPEAPPRQEPVHNPEPPREEPPQPGHQDAPYPRFDRDPFGTADARPPQGDPPPRRQRRAAPSKMILVIAASAVLVVILALIGVFLGISAKDRARIDAIKSGTLGQYDTMTLQDSLYAAFGSEYDTATWEGCFAPFPARGVVVTFSHSQDEAEPVEITFQVGKDGCFKVASLNGEEDSDTIAFYLHNLFAHKLGYVNQVDLLEQMSVHSVLYGATGEFDGDAASIPEVFGDEVYGDKTAAQLLDLDQTGAATRPEGGKNDPAGSTGDPEEPTKTEQPIQIRIEPGEYRDVNTDYRALTLSIDASDPENYLYCFTVTNAKNLASRIDYHFKGHWDEAASCVRFSEGTVTETANPLSDARARTVRSDLSGTVRVENGQILWENQTEGTLLTFAPGNAPLNVPGISTQVTNNAPSTNSGRIQVVSASATSTINQETVDNGPMVMFDGQDESSWQEGVDGYGIGESFTFRMRGYQQVEMIAFKLGNWRNDRYFTTNAAPKTLTVQAGDVTVQGTFEHSRNVQYLVFSEPVYAEEITIHIDDVHPGTEYDDTCINEVTVYGHAYE